MRNGQPFHQVHCELLGNGGKNTLLFVKSLLVRAHQAALVVDLETNEILLFGDWQGSQDYIVREVLWRWTCGVIWKVPVLEGIWRRAAVRVGELTGRLFVEDFDLLKVIRGDLDKFVARLRGCLSVSLNFTQSARMAGIVRLDEQARGKEGRSKFVDKLRVKLKRKRELRGALASKKVECDNPNLLCDRLSWQSWNSSSD